MYKFIKIIYDSVIHEKITDFLQKEHVEKYAEIPKLKCKWCKDIRHLDTHVWPGTDSMIELFIEEEKLKAFLEDFRYLKDNLNVNVPLLAAVMPVDEIIA